MLCYALRWAVKPEDRAHMQVQIVSRRECVMDQLGLCDTDVLHGGLLVLLAAQLGGAVGDVDVQLQHQNPRVSTLSFPVPRALWNSSLL